VCSEAQQVLGRADFSLGGDRQITKESNELVSSTKAERPGEVEAS
jgi:hypothetical protein